MPPGQDITRTHDAGQRLTRLAYHLTDLETAVAMAQPGSILQ